MVSPGLCRCRPPGGAREGAAPFLPGGSGETGAEHRLFSAPLSTVHLPARRDWGTFAIPPLQRDPPCCPGPGLPLIGAIFPPVQYLHLSPPLPSCHRNLTGPLPPALSVGTKFSQFFSGAVRFPAVSCSGVCCPTQTSWCSAPTTQPLQGPLLQPLS